MIKRITCLLFIIGVMISFSGLLTDNAYAKRMTPEQRQAQNDKRNLASMEKKIRDIKRFMDRKFYNYIGNNIRSANQYYARISDSYKKDPSVVKAKETLTNLEKEYKRVTGAQTAANNKAENFKKLGWEFGKELEKHKMILNFLFQGKNNQKGRFYYKNEVYKQKYEALDKLEKLMKTKYAALISESPYHVVRGYGMVKDVNDLVVNRAKYFKNRMENR